MGETIRDGYSVLMAVYEKEKPEFFRQSLQSMLDQTLPFSDFVLVCDGPLTEGLEAVIGWAQAKMGERLQCVRLPRNGGLGRALRAGIRYCRCPLVARMDSDDISRPERCALQVRALQQGDYDIVGGSLREFQTHPGDADTVRTSPRSHEEILVYAKKRNPFNHPCVMYRREAVLRAGNYQDFPGFEDYYLWVRMLRCGCRGQNLPQVILDMRIGNGMHGRRGGRQYVRSAIRFQQYLRRAGFIGRGQYLFNCCVRAGVGLMPGGLRKGFYGRILRGKF